MKRRERSVKPSFESVSSSGSPEAKETKIRNASFESGAGSQTGPNRESPKIFKTRSASPDVKEVQENELLEEALQGLELNTVQQIVEHQQPGGIGFGNFQNAFDSPSTQMGSAATPTEERPADSRSSSGTNMSMLESTSTEAGVGDVAGGLLIKKNPPLACISHQNHYYYYDYASNAGSTLAFMFGFLSFLASVIVFISPPEEK